MQVRIQSIHFDADQKLLQIIESKLQTFDQYLTKLEAEAKVILKMEKVGQVSDKIVEIIVNLPGHPLIVKAKDKTFEKAFYMVLHSLRRQLLRFKEKLQQKH